MIDGFERDHASAEGRLSLDRLPEGIWILKTVYNRFARWSERGIWRRIFETVAAPSKPQEQVAWDSSHVKAHRSQKKGRPGTTARSTRDAMSSSRRLGRLKDFRRIATRYDELVALLGSLPRRYRHVVAFYYLTPDSYIKRPNHAATL